SRKDLDVSELEIEQVLLHPLHVAADQPRVEQLDPERQGHRRDGHERAPRTAPHVAPRHLEDVHSSRRGVLCLAKSGDAASSIVRTMNRLPETSRLVNGARKYKPGANLLSARFQRAADFSPSIQSLPQNLRQPETAAATVPEKAGNFGGGGRPLCLPWRVS